MDEMNQLKVFTVTEANKLLPQIASLIQEVQKKREQILSLEVEIDALELIHEKDENGFSPVLNKKVENYARQVNQFYKLVEDIHALGCLLKDVDTGLVDFYSMYKGRVVHLCWKLGESEISHWHEVGSGFTSRQPLEKHDCP